MTERILALARSISPKTIESCKKRNIADENEARYAGCGHADENPSDIAARYRSIAAGFDNGRCTTRVGTYRRFKGLTKRGRHA